MAFFKFRQRGQPPTPEPVRRGRGKEPAPNPQESIDGMRRRARHRLVGAAVLVLLAVIGFPLLFDTQPRPVAVNAPITIPDKNKAAPLKIPEPVPANASLGDDEEVVTPANAASSRARADAAAKTTADEAARAKADESAKAKTEATAKAKTEEVAKARADEAARAKADEAAKARAEQAARTKRDEERADAQAQREADARAKREQEARAKREAEQRAKRDEAARARALLEGRGNGGEAAADAAKGGRFIVQVGAFADEGAVREARQKAERAGVRTYTQVVQTSAGPRTRVRVGPFSSREEAEKVAAALKKAGLGGSILGL